MDRKIVGKATEEETNQIYILFTKLQSAEKLLSQKPSNVDDRSLKIYYEAALNLKCDIEAAMSRWWDAATKKYSLNGETSIDFNSCELYQDKN